MNKWILSLSILAGSLRPFMPQRHGFTEAMTYEALSHIIVGLLIGGWIFAEKKKPYWITLIIITLIEVFCGLRK